MHLPIWPKAASHGGPTVLGGAAVLAEVVRRVVTRTIARCDAGEERLERVLFETVYQEERRLARVAPDHRTQADADFVSVLRRGLVHGESQLRDLLYTAVLRYTQEICGVFDPQVYRFATRWLPPSLAVLMHGGRPSSALFNVEDRVLIEGELEALRSATRLGTVVLVPTHVSNLDSLLLGYAILALGLEPFAYGAGLNLFSNPLTGYFMRNLGAFTVDRQKSDPLYRATAKEYMTVLLEHGQHVLFFPGGTRSRAGAIERKLKLGFLGTAVTAFGNLQRLKTPRPIFIVPCTLSYPLVLEASSLIREYLRNEGGPQYLEVRDEFEHPTRWYDFLRGLSQLDVQVHVRFGQPLDILGHPVDARGISHGPGGYALDPASYLRVNGEPCEDAARDAQYTHVLADRVLESFRRSSVALPSSLLAFACFERLRLKFPQLDVFRLLRALGDQASVPRADVAAGVQVALDGLRRLSKAGALTLAPELATGTTEELIDRAVATLSSYHRVPVLVAREGSLHVGDPALLLYYRSRLDGYGLPGAPTLAELLAQRVARKAA